MSPFNIKNVLLSVLLLDLFHHNNLPHSVREVSLLVVFLVVKLLHCTKAICGPQDYCSIQWCRSKYWIYRPVESIHIIYTYVNNYLRPWSSIVYLLCVVPNNEQTSVDTCHWCCLWWHHTHLYWHGNDDKHIIHSHLNWGSLMLRWCKNVFHVLVRVCGW